MSRMLFLLRKMLSLTEDIGVIDEVYMGDWVGKYDRINVTGKTQDGRDFTLTLEIDKEVKEDA